MRQSQSDSPTPTLHNRGRAHRYRDVAKMLNCSSRQVMRLVEAGKLKATYISERCPRIFDDELDKYVAAQGGE
jgi:excisionase family DNA binding protein